MRAKYCPGSGRFLFDDNNYQSWQYYNNYCYCGSKKKMTQLFCRARLPRPKTLENYDFAITVKNVFRTAKWGGSWLECRMHLAEIKSTRPRLGDEYLKRSYCVLDDPDARVKGCRRLVQRKQQLLNRCFFFFFLITFKIIFSIF